jgi:hypothetical protein
MTKVDYLIGFAGVEIDPCQDLKHLFQAPIFYEKAERETAQKLHLHNVPIETKC